MADELNAMQIGVITLVVVGLLLGVGLTVLDGFADATAHTSPGNTFTQNGTHYLNTTGFYTNTTAEDCLITSVLVYNGTGAGGGGEVILESGNYTYSGCQVVGSGAGLYDGYAINVTGVYSYLAPTAASDSIDSAITAGGTYSDYFSLIVIVIIAGVVLTLLFIAFGRRD